jgi:hypothetical protein
VAARRFPAIGASVFEYLDQLLNYGCTLARQMLQVVSISLVWEESCNSHRCSGSLVFAQVTDVLFRQLPRCPKLPQINRRASHGNSFENQCRIFLVFTLSVSHSAAQTQSPDTDQGPSLADVARTYRAEKSKDQVTRPDIKHPTEELNSKDEDSAGPEQFKDEVQQLLVERKFDELEKLSEQATSRRSKFTGGVWKLFMFYDVIPHPPDGTFHLEAIKAWVGAKPESAAARTALAQAYVSSGFRSRGLDGPIQFPRAGGRSWPTDQSLRELLCLKRIAWEKMPTGLR